MGRRRRFVNIHHIKARSRFPFHATREEMDYDNTVELDQDFHEAWHHCFGTMTPEEAIMFLRTVMVPGTRWNRHELEKLRQHILRR